MYERLAPRTELLVVFAHPPVLIDPGKRPFSHPSSPRASHGSNGFIRSGAWEESVATTIPLSPSLRTAEKRPYAVR